MVNSPLDNRFIKRDPLYARPQEMVMATSIAAIVAPLRQSVDDRREPKGYTYVEHP